MKKTKKAGFLLSIQMQFFIVKILLKLFVSILTGLNSVAYYIQITTYFRIWYLGRKQLSKTGDHYTSPSKPMLFGDDFINKF